MSLPDLVVTVDRNQGRVTVLLAGELDVHGAPTAHVALEDAAATAERVVLDLRALEFIDSSGLKLLLVWHRRLAERQVPFAVVRGPAHVQRPFSSAGLDGLLPFMDGPPA